MIINLIKELNQLYEHGGISNITYRNLILNNLYNDVVTCMEYEDQI